MNKTELNKIFREKKLDVIFTTSEQTRLWYTGIQTSAGYLAIEKTKKSNLFLDGRYIEFGTKNAKNVKVNLFKGLKTLQDFAKTRKYKVIGIESNYMTLDELEFIKKIFPKAKFVNINGQALRIIKDEDEIKLMRKAGSIAMKALESIKPLIKPGITEIQLDTALEKALRDQGATKGSFDAIVVSGKNTALPHGNPSNKKLKAGEFLTIDFGAIYKGYCSDITRTFHVGKVTNKKLLEIETVLRKAQKMGVKAVRPGVTTGQIDKICRDYITEKGYGEYFVHSTGHGLGIDVHELPNVSQHKVYDVKLKPGMVITVEPGIYIEGLGGIRVEDDVLVTKTGHRILSAK